LRKKFERIVPETISIRVSVGWGGDSPGRIVVAQQRPTQNKVPAKMPAKKG
jgi:hypothetical protein